MKLPFAHCRRWLTAAAILLLTAGLAQAGTVTYLRLPALVGTAESGPWRELEIGAAVTTGTFLKTGPGGCVEVRLPDGSFVRLGPDSLLRIDQSVFADRTARRFSARLFLGRLWSNVARALGGGTGGTGRFEVVTPTAIAGVRGTVYDLRAAADRSTDIWVYEGSVALGPSIFKPDGPREPMAWPGEVSERQWEEIILKKLQRLHVDPDGRPQAPRPFDPERDADDWAQWNLQRDREQR